VLKGTEIRSHGILGFEVGRERETETPLSVCRIATDKVDGRGFVADIPSDPKNVRRSLLGKIVSPYSK